VHKQAVPGLADLTLSYTEGEDGSLVSDGLEYKGEDCEPQSLTDADDVYCVPTRTAQADDSDFETTDCSGPPLAETGSPTEPLLINKWQRDEASGCERISGYYEVGAMTTQRSLRFETMCLPVGAGGSSRHYHLGAAIEETRFPRLKAVEVGSGRLRKTQYQGPDGIVVGWTHDWRDTMLDIRCTLELTITPELLCRPADVHGVSRVFSDAQCARAIHDFRTCTPLDAVHYTTEHRPSMACPGHYDITVHRVTRYTGPVYASDRSPSFSCEPIDGAAKPYFQLGTALSSSELAAFEYTME